MDSKQVNRTLKIYIDKQEIDGSVKSIKSKVQELTREMNKLTVGTDEYKQKAKQIRELNGILAQHRQSIRAAGNEYQSLSSRFGKLADGVNRYTGVVAGAIGAVTGLTLTVRKAVQEYAKMQEAEAQVRKYTGMTADEVERLNEDLKKMDTRTAREELNALAGDAGRLGITSREAILEFVDGADKIKVALGDDLGENAVRDIGKLAQMFGEDKKKGLRGAMLATGSAVNELAQNSSAGAGAIVEFTARLAGVAQQAGMTQAQIMGIGSVMDQNMQEIPTSATVISQLITKMMQDTSRFAKIAGEDVKSFSELLRTDANAALVKFLEAMKSRGGFADMAKMFDEMKMDGSRAVGVLSALAGHLDQLAAAQNLANQAYDEGTSVLNEFNVQNSTVQAELDKAKKQFLEISIELGQKLLPIAKYGITTGSAAVKMLSRLINFGAKYIVTITSLTVAIAALTVARNKDIIMTKLQVFWNDKLVKGFKTLTAVMAKNPWTAAVLVVTTLVGLIADLTRRTNENAAATDHLADAEREASREMANEKGKLDALYKATQDTNKSTEERKYWIGELRKAFPGYFKDLSDEAILAGQASSQYELLSRNILKAARARAYQRKIDELSEQNVNLETSADETTDWLTRNEARYRRAKQHYEQTGHYTWSDARFMREYRRREKEAVKSMGEIAMNEKRISELQTKALENIEPAGDVAVTQQHTGQSAGARGTGARGGKNTPDAETLRQKRVQEELLKIQTEYQEKRNAVTERYVSGEITTTEWLGDELERLEMERLERELTVAGLDKSQRAKVESEILELRKTWRERDVAMLQSLDEIELEQTKQHLEEMQQEEEEATAMLVEAEQERARLILDVAGQFGTSFGEMMGDFFENGEIQFGEFLKNIIKLTLDALEKTMVAAVAERTIKDVASFGLAGIGKAAAEIALITAAFETAKGLISSFDVGGFTGSGRWDEPRGVVHANEFVANRHALANPSVMPVLSLIDAAQKSGSIANLRSEDIAGVLPVRGGAVTQRYAGHDRNRMYDGAADKELMALLSSVGKSTQQLTERLKRPIVAETFATGKRGVNEAQDLVDKMRKNVSRG